MFLAPLHRMLTAKPRVRIVEVMRILATYFPPRAKQRLTRGLCITDWLLGVFAAGKKKGGWNRKIL